MQGKWARGVADAAPYRFCRKVCDDGKVARADMESAPTVTRRVVVIAGRVGEHSICSRAKSPPKSQHSQPGQQGFEANQNQDNAADALGGGAVLIAEQGTHAHADGGQQAGDAADQPCGGQDVDLHGGKADADGKCVDTGGDGQRQHRFGRVVIIELFVAAEALTHHVNADDGQQYKSDPGAELGQDRGKTVAQEKAQRGHQELEAAEPQPAGHSVGKADLADRKALADRNGKSVHGKADGDQDQVK